MPADGLRYDTNGRLMLREGPSDYLIAHHPDRTRIPARSLATAICSNNIQWDTELYYAVLRWVERNRRPGFAAAGAVAAAMTFKGRHEFGTGFGPIGTIVLPRSIHREPLKVSFTDDQITGRTFFVEERQTSGSTNRSRHPESVFVNDHETTETCHRDYIQDKFSSVISEHRQWWRSTIRYSREDGEPFPDRIAEDYISLMVFAEEHGMCEDTFWNLTAGFEPGDIHRTFNAISVAIPSDVRDTIAFSLLVSA